MATPFFQPFGWGVSHGRPHQPNGEEEEYQEKTIATSVSDAKFYILRRGVFHGRPHRSNGEEEGSEEQTCSVNLSMEIRFAEIAACGPGMHFLPSKPTSPNLTRMQKFQDDWEENRREGRAGISSHISETEMCDEMINETKGGRKEKTRRKE